MSRPWLPIALVIVGCAGMLGDVAGLTTVKGIAAATAASPAPKVFSSARGLETFSTAFELRWTDADGSRRVLPLDKTVYPRLRGPYNRRNVYGAVLAFGPVLATTPVSRAMYEAAAAYGLCGDAPVLVELGVDPARVVGPVQVRYVPRPGSAPDADLPMLLETRCAR